MDGLKSLATISSTSDEWVLQFKCGCTCGKDSSGSDDKKVTTTQANILWCYATSVLWKRLRLLGCEHIPRTCNVHDVVVWVRISPNRLELFRKNKVNFMLRFPNTNETSINICKIWKTWIFWFLQGYKAFESSLV